MPYDADLFFERVRVKPFGGSLSQQQVDGMNYLMSEWECRFEESAAEQSTPWLAYCLATVFHETATQMRPIEEYGRGSGHEYGKPTGPYGQCYYGRGHVQLTWEENYIKGQGVLDEYGMNVPLHQYPHRMLEDQPSAIVLFDGMIDGWFTGVGLPKFFDENTEDPVNARTIVNGHDKDTLIADYYYDFKAALVQIDVPKRRRPALQGLRK